MTQRFGYCAFIQLVVQKMLMKLVGIKPVEQ